MTQTGCPGFWVTPFVSYFLNLDVFVTVMQIQDLVL
jgi:hypothetical protein